MTETQKRIRAYKKALPELRERVVAVALLLAMSASMMTSATFAWLTISRAPEVSSVTTNIAANGNLEIALVKTDGKEPGESAVGDSSAAENQSVTSANITWGNLINLADPSYGLENLTLRPAQLNTASLLTSPLYGAVYETDGRIDELTSDFAYTSWVPPEGDKPGYFGVSDSYGVRAISSTKITAVGADAIYTKMLSAANSANLKAANAYAGLSKNTGQMNSLATMMGLYMTARMNPNDASLSNPDCDIEHLQNLYNMYVGFLEAFDLEAEAIAAMLNLQLFLKEGEGAYTPYTKEMVYATNDAELKGKGLVVERLDEFLKDHKTIATDAVAMKALIEGGTTLKWKDSGLNTIVDHLVNVGECTIGADNTPIKNIGASNASSYITGTQEARITNGILYRFEERTGGYIEVQVSISAKVKRMGITVPASVTANIKTTALRSSNLFNEDLIKTQAMKPDEFKGGVATAQDTYGLAIDLWLRTNATGSYLTLEGNIISETKKVQAMGTDDKGNPVELYTLTVPDSEYGEGYSVDVYQLTENGKTIVKDAISHSELTAEEVSSGELLRKMEDQVTVLGYEGENRIWGDNDMLSIDATTQGSGSCYVYYADSPEDQNRSLKLLEAFKVAFVDQKGELMAEAVMDTEHYYAENGRVTVPLVMDESKSINLGADYLGNTIYAITAMNQNEATRITAIVYLDGTKLSNQDVLAASDIQGQLNIQFGSNVSMTAMTDEKLEQQERRVSASVDKTEFNWDTATEPMTTNVTVQVDGDEPTTVTAFFLRSISATQGSREDTMTFTKNADGTWSSSYTFTAPGNYILRTVRLDGVDYDLAEPPTVSVDGFTIASLSCAQATNNTINIMTAAGSSTVDLSMTFATNDRDKMPNEVQGRFLNESGTVNVNFIYNPTTNTWNGSANFIQSGTYTLQYLLLDGEYTELKSDMWQTATVTLGMRVEVRTTSPHSFKYIPSEMTDNQKLLQMQVKILDNAGNELTGMSGAKLTYKMKGSNVKQMDTDLTWSSSYYVGEMPTDGPGIWQFSNVTVDGNVLTTATISPTFTIQSPEPPEYYGIDTTGYQYRPNNDAKMGVSITNSPAATVQAKIVKAGQSDGVWVDGTIVSEFTTPAGKYAYNWFFAVPKDANGHQDGNWQLTELRLWDVFAADGTAYTEEEPLVIDVSNTENKTKVVTRVYVTFEADKSQDFGKNGSGTVNGGFMTSYSVSGVAVTIKDFEGKALNGIKDVKLSYKHGKDSAKFGGYTSNQLTEALTDFTINLESDSSGTYFAQSGTQTLLYAGSYTPTFSFSMPNEMGVQEIKTYSGENLPENTPKFTVSSVAPTAKITARTSYGSSTNTDYSATVYFNSSSSTCGTNYSQPYVTITLAGMGNAEKATMTFSATGGGTVHLYNSNGDSTATSEYSWTANGACQRWVGYYKSKSMATDDKTAAGTLTATTLTMTYGGVSYTFDVEDITINNPS